MATARGIVGAEVVAKGECQFVAQDGSALRIRIGGDFIALVNQCRAHSDPIKGIGNEAVACTVGREERLIGRVREKAFVVVLMPANRQKILAAAEIVAGNLY